MEKTIKVYGADWCGDTKKTHAHLDDLNLDYQYINVEQNEEASQWVKSQNDGKEKKPTLDIGGQILSVPKDSELDSVLKQQGFIS